MSDVKVIWVKVEVKGFTQKLELPFILPLGWTTEDRNALAEKLKKLHALWEDIQGGICFTILYFDAVNDRILNLEFDAVNSRILNLEDRRLLLDFFRQTCEADSLPWTVQVRNGQSTLYDDDTREAIRKAWFISQIGMLEVRTDYDFGA